jgi:hypothetical protein
MKYVIAAYSILLHLFALIGVVHTVHVFNTEYAPAKYVQMRCQVEYEVIINHQDDPVNFQPDADTMWKCIIATEDWEGE